MGSSRSAMAMRAARSSTPGALVRVTWRSTAAAMACSVATVVAVAHTRPEAPAVATRGRASGSASTRSTVRPCSAGSAPKSSGATATTTWRRAKTLRAARGPSGARA